MPIGLAGAPRGALLRVWTRTPATRCPNSASVRCSKACRWPRTAGRPAAPAAASSEPADRGHARVPARAVDDDPELWLQRIHPDDRERVMSEETDGSSTGALDKEYRFLHADGRIVWVRDQARWVVDPSGEAASRACSPTSPRASASRRSSRTPRATTPSRVSSTAASSRARSSTSCCTAARPAAPCCSSTSTASSSSTTATATRRAMRCCARRAVGCSWRCAKATCSRASAVTSSPPTCPTATPTALRLAARAC